MLNVLKQLFHYYFNDPDEPIVADIEMPGIPDPCPPYMVDGFTGRSSDYKTKEYHAMLAEITFRHTLNVVQGILDTKIISWAATPELKIYPRAGRALNAYYDRGSLKFFYANNPINKKIMFTVESADIVSHETGHAILDCLRPDLWAVQSLEIMAFHESFADIIAIVSGLNHDIILDYILKETNGDMSRSNAITRIAEELGSVISKGKNPLRDAVNTFIYSNPESLPRSAPYEQISGESHSFSRLFTGIFWDIIVFSYERERKNRDDKSALMISRDYAIKTLLNAIRVTSVTPRFYQAVMSSMISVDKFDIKNFVQQSFNRRGIEVEKNIEEDITCVKKCILSEEMGIVGNPLYDVKIQIPAKLTEGFCVSEEDIVYDESLEGAKASLDLLYESGKVGEGREFVVEDGELKRNFVCII